MFWQRFEAGTLRIRSKKYCPFNCDFTSLPLDRTRNLCHESPTDWMLCTEKTLTSGVATFLPFHSPKRTVDVGNIWRAFSYVTREHLAKIRGRSYITARRSYWKANLALLSQPIIVTNRSRVVEGMLCIGNAVYGFPETFLQRAGPFDVYRYYQV
jgi:hypothetical protein